MCISYKKIKEQILHKRREKLKMLNKIGITERGDAGIDLSWSKKLDSVAFAIIITKSVNDSFIEEIIKHKEKTILHATITGYGNTILEPNVFDYTWSYVQILKLIEKGFNPKHIVLRVDPVIPTKKGIKTAEDVLKIFSNTEIERVRYSFLDIYNHVKKRFSDAKLPIPYEYLPSQDMIEKFLKMLKKYNFQYESCAEETPHKLGCISKKDVNILGLNIELIGKNSQRIACLCPINKFELLEHKNQCSHKCLYCYWK